MISDDSTINISEEVISCDLEEEVAMLNMKDSVYYGLNPVGARIWKIIQKPISFGSILEILLEEYEVDEKQCRNDLINLLQELLDKGLIEIE